MVDHKKIAHHRKALPMIEPERIKVLPGLNARDMTTPDNVQHIRDIANSIRTNGFLESEPLECASIDNELVLTAGHCRMAAIELLRREGHVVEFVPYIPEGKGTDEIQRIVNQRVSNMGKPLTPLEEGFNVKRLMGKGLDVGEIARRTGRSPTYIEQLLSLQAAPSEIKEMVATKQVAAKVATDAIKAVGETEATEVLRESVAAARATGKKKATPKDIQSRLEKRDESKRFRVAWKPKTQLLGVRIGNTEFSFSPETWLEMGEKIVKAAREFVENRAAPQAPIEHTPPAEAQPAT